ncbi:hypothetical protein BRADI_3g00460v3 [Brachypodium distachyon]|uniref:Ubiquitin-like protease family profile domain-containing protein n=1 Tax=Brachypodium distachyon TaxID=15368 RepID=I1HW08_BRADI|nr:hypothetical protein BRADI_3g00460v3 [Brachypodium distachyon]
MAPWWTNLKKLFREHDLEKNGEYVPGEPFLTEYELKNVSPRCRDLHSYYLQVFQRQQGINLSIEHHHFHHSDGALSITVPWSDLWNLYNLKELNASLMRCWTLHLIKIFEEEEFPIGFMDPHWMSGQSIEADRNKSRNYVADALAAHTQRGKEMIIVAYYSVEYDHCIMIAIFPSENSVSYLDSTQGNNWSNVAEFIDEAWSLARDKKGLESGNPKLSHDFEGMCLRKQTMLVECDMKKIRNQLCDFLMEELDASSSELVTSKLEECSLASSMSE